MKKQGRIYRFTPDEAEHIRNTLKERNYRQEDIQAVIDGLEKICHYYMVSFPNQGKPSEYKRDLSRTLGQIERSHDALVDHLGTDRHHRSLEDVITYAGDPEKKIRDKMDGLAEVSRLRVAHRTMQKQMVEQIRPLQKDGGRPGADDDGLGYLILSLLYRVLKLPRVAVCEALTAACLEAVGLPAKDPSRRVKAARDMLAERGVSPVIDEKIIC